MSEEMENGNNTVTVGITTQVNIDIPEFCENDRTDLVIGIGEVYGREGCFSRTDFGYWNFNIGIGANKVCFNIFMEDDGRLNVNGLSGEDAKIDLATLLEKLKPIADKIYAKLMCEKYAPLFKKYGIVDWEDLRSKNKDRSGLDAWITGRWKRGNIVIVDDHSVQNGNVGMSVHTWENARCENPHRARIDYYVDFPGTVFKPNCFGGSQRPDDIAKWGRKMNSVTQWWFSSNDKRNEFIVNALLCFSSGKPVGLGDCYVVENITTV